MDIPIVFSTDHNFVMPTCVTIHSLLAAAKEGVRYEINVIIDPDVTEEDKVAITRQAKRDNPATTIDFIEIGNTFENGYEIRDISRACYNRLMIPWLLPQYDRVVYSDVDIIFNGDISDIYLREMDGNYVAGVHGDVWGKGLIRKYLKKIGADPTEYINSGFLLINSKAQRENNLKQRYLEYSREDYLYQDQDIINLVCKGHIGHLPREYNLKPEDYHNEKTGKVVHFIGLKPWNTFTYAWRLWWDSYASSTVYDPGREKTVSTRILRWNEEIKKRVKAAKQKLKFLHGIAKSR